MPLSSPLSQGTAVMKHVVVLFAGIVMGCTSREARIADCDPSAKGEQTVLGVSLEGLDLPIKMPTVAYRVGRPARIPRSNITYAPNGETGFLVENSYLNDNSGVRVQELAFKHGGTGKTVFENQPCYFGVATCFTRDGRYLLVTDQKRMIQWDIDARRQVRTMMAPPLPKHKVFCGTGFKLRAVVAEDDNTVYTNFLNTVAWDLTTGKVTVVSDQLRGYSTGFEGIRSWLPGSELTIMRNKQTIGILRPTARVTIGECIGNDVTEFQAKVPRDTKIIGDFGLISAYVFSSDYGRMFLQTYDCPQPESVYEWDLQSGRVRSVAPLPDYATLGALALSGDEQILYIADGTIRTRSQIHAFNLGSRKWVGLYILPPSFCVDAMWVSPEADRLIVRGHVFREAHPSEPSSQVLHYDLLEAGGQIAMEDADLAPTRIARSEPPQIELVSVKKGHTGDRRFKYFVRIWYTRLSNEPIRIWAEAYKSGRESSSGIASSPVIQDQEGVVQRWFWLSSRRTFDSVRISVQEEESEAEIFDHRFPVPGAGINVN